MFSFINIRFISKLLKGLKRNRNVYIPDSLSASELHDDAKRSPITVTVLSPTDRDVVDSTPVMPALCTAFLVVGTYGT